MNLALYHEYCTRFSSSWVLYESKRIPQKLVIKNKFNVGIYFLLHVEKNCLVLAKAELPLLVMYPVSDKEKKSKFVLFKS